MLRNVTNCRRTMCHGIGFMTQREKERAGKVCINFTLHRGGYNAQLFSPVRIELRKLKSCLKC